MMWQDCQVLSQYLDKLYRLIRWLLLSLFINYFYYVATALWDYPHLTQVIHFGSYWFYSGTFREMDISILQLTLLIGKYHNVASSRFMLVLGKLGTGFQFVLHLAKFKNPFQFLKSIFIICWLVCASKAI